MPLKGCASSKCARSFATSSTLSAVELMLLVLKKVMKIFSVQPLVEKTYAPAVMRLRAFSPRVFWLTLAMPSARPGIPSFELISDFILVDALVLRDESSMTLMLLAYSWFLRFSINVEVLELQRQQNIDVTILKSRTVKITGVVKFAHLKNDECFSIEMNFTRLPWFSITFFDYWSDLTGFSQRKQHFFQGPRVQFHTLGCNQECGKMVEMSFQNKN